MNSSDQSISFHESDEWPVPINRERKIIAHYFFFAKNMNGIFAASFFQLICILCNITTKKVFFPINAEFLASKTSVLNLIHNCEFYWQNVSKILPEEPWSLVVVWVVACEASGPGFNSSSDRKVFSLLGYKEVGIKWIPDMKNCMLLRIHVEKKNS